MVKLHFRSPWSLEKVQKFLELKKWKKLENSKKKKSWKISKLKLQAFAFDQQREKAVSFKVVLLIWIQILYQYIIHMANEHLDSECSNCHIWVFTPERNRKIELYWNIMTLWLIEPRSQIKIIICHLSINLKQTHCLLNQQMLWRGYHKSLENTCYQNTILTTPTTV